MAVISFKTTLFIIKDWTILRLPEDASAKLPSRGMTMVKGTINSTPFKTLLEPDGRHAPGKKPSHWFRIENALQKEINAKAGDEVKVEIEPAKDWIEPELPADMKSALLTSAKAKGL